MAKFSVPKATSAARKAGIPLAGELLYDKDEKAMYYGDGSTEGGVALHNRSQETAFVYGLDYDLDTSSTSGTKVVLNHAYDYEGASTALRYHAVDSFAQTPAHAFQSVLRDLEHGVNKCFLDVSDSTKRANGTALTADEKIGKWTENGSTVLVDFMLRIPITYWRKDTYTDGSSHHHVVWLVSNEQFVDSAPHPWFFTGAGGATAQVQYVGMFKGVLTDSTGTPKTQSAEDTSVDYASNDRLRSIMGYRPAGYITRPNFRAAAASNHGFLTNLLFREWLTLMVAIDGGDFNSQSAFSTGLSNCSTWNYASLRKTGRAATFGLQTGEIIADETESTGLDLDMLTMKDGGSIWNNSGTKVVSFCWRGLEDPWGAQFEFAEGCQKNQNATADDYTDSGYWVTNDTSLYVNCDTSMNPGQYGEKFPSRGYTGNSYAWVSHPFPKTENYIKTFDTDSFLPLTVAGSLSTSYFGDYFWNNANSGACVVCFGGRAYSGVSDGVGSASVYYALGYRYAYLGARLAASASE